MEHSLELTSALNELKRITGITMNISVDTQEEETLAITQIRCLCTAYKEKYSKIHFLQSLMTSETPTYDVTERALRMHIDPEEQRVLFLLETKNPLDDTVMEVLMNLYSAH